MSGLTPAPDGYPIKLVRDRTPAILNASGEPGGLFYDDLPPAERDKWLRLKLMEEAAEYLVSPHVDELADILAVIEALAHHHGRTLHDLQTLMEDDPRGGFLAGRMMRGHHPEFDGGAPRVIRDRQQAVARPLHRSPSPTTSARDVGASGRVAHRR